MTTVNNTGKTSSAEIEKLTAELSSLDKEIEQYDDLLEEMEDECRAVRNNGFESPPTAVSGMADDIRYYLSGLRKKRVDIRKRIERSGS